MQHLFCLVRLAYLFLWSRDRQRSSDCQEGLATIGHNLCPCVDEWHDVLDVSRNDRHDDEHEVGGNLAEGCETLPRPLIEFLREKFYTIEQCSNVKYGEKMGVVATCAVVCTMRSPLQSAICFQDDHAA